MSIDEATASELTVSLIHVIKKVTAIRNQMPTSHAGIETSSYPILMTLQPGPLRVSELASRIHSDASTVSRQVAQLAVNNYVEKVSDPTDGRAQQVQLTEPGRTLVADLVSKRAAWMQGLLRDWNVNDVNAFQLYLGRFNDELAAELDRLQQKTPNKEQQP